MSKQLPSSGEPASRRNFLKTSGAAIVGGSIAASLGPARMAHASSDETLKVGLIGCGGRGTGAAANAMKADVNAKITVMCDLFPDRLENCRKQLKTKLGDQYDVSDDACFSGFEGYKDVMASDVDVVLLATTPHFRPQQFKAAIEAGKHVFCEKPVAVDAPGVRSVMETANLAKEKNLNVVSGLCWRYDIGVNAVIDRIQNGDIGDITAIQENYLTGTLWHRGNKPEWSQMEYQMRNWMYFTWLSGDHIVEQHIHSLDKALWLMGDKPPVKAFGLGGRQVRTGEQWGNIYDHFAVCYEWESGFKTFAYTRQMNGCLANVDDYIIGTKGRAQILKGTINGEKVDIGLARGERKPSMYDVEHQHLFNAIRKGQTINNGDYMCKSTLLAIMGREACYTGQSINWDELWNSDVSLGPKSYEWGDVPFPAVARPGKRA